MVPKLCRELPLMKLMMPPKGILMIHSYGEARDHFVHEGISGGPTQLVAINEINSCGTVHGCTIAAVLVYPPWDYCELVFRCPPLAIGNRGGRCK